MPHIHTLYIEWFVYNYPNTAESQRATRRRWSGNGSTWAYLDWKREWWNGNVRFDDKIVNESEMITARRNRTSETNSSHIPCNSCYIFHFNFNGNIYFHSFYVLALLHFHANFLSSLLCTLSFSLFFHSPPVFPQISMPWFSLKTYFVVVVLCVEPITWLFCCVKLLAPITHIHITYHLVEWFPEKSLLPYIKRRSS